jgi:hypothetical protein
MRKTIFPAAPRKGRTLTTPSGKKHQPKNTPFTVTAVYHLLLEALLELKILSAEQMTRRYYLAGSITTVKNRLTRLERNGYIDHLKLPTTKGNAGYLYFLARKGRRYFQEGEEDIKDYYRPSKEKEKSYFHLMHLLEVNDILIAARMLPKIALPYSLSELLHDYDLQHDPFYITVDRLIQARIDGVIKSIQREETLALIPDALVEYRRTPSTIPGKPFDRIGIWHEHNRTGGAKRFKPKIRAILEVIGSGGYKKLLDVPSLRVAITTSGGELRKRKLRQWTEEVLEETAQKEKGTALSSEARRIVRRYENVNIFYFATTPPFASGCIVPRTYYLEKVWYQPFSSKPVALLSKAYLE